MDQVPSFGSEIQITQYLFAWGRNKDGELSIVLNIAYLRGKSKEKQLAEASSRD